MENIITASKYVPETISIIVSFADLLLPGDTISGVPTISVSVSSGIDPSPSQLLYQGPSVTRGNTVEQRIRLGVAGVIYEILFSIQTIAGDTWEKSTLLAVLAGEGTPIPTYLPLTLTTQLYPLDVVDYYKGSISLISGALIQVVIPYTALPDSYKSAIAFVAGTLTGPIQLPYTAQPDAYKASVAFVSGTLVSIQKQYTARVDQYKASVAFISGALTVIVVPYSTPSDQYKASAAFTAGTLT